MSRMVFALAMALVVHPVHPDYKSQILQWRERRVASLKSDDGWLTVAGLFWLNEGRNTVGTATGNDFVLPKGSAPARVGAFEFRNGVTTFEPAPGTDVTVDGKPLTSAPLKPDITGNPDIIRVRGLTLFVIQRGPRVGIRLKDRNSEMRRDFTGIKYFPIHEAYRVVARFVPYSPPKTIPVADIIGLTSQEPSPGYVAFELNGRHCRLDSIEEDGQLFFIFKDLTSGKETYPPGRFLYTAMPKDGQVVLDFNKAYNPPCAFTPYATCPLPPPENHLPIRVEAGELRYGH